MALAQLDFNKLEQNYQQTAPKAAPKKKVGGMKGLLANLLPLIGGTVGAVGGSFVAPVAGTAAGGAAGSALGEYAKQKLLGEKTNLGSIAGQGALGAIPGVGKIIGKGVQAAKAGVGARALAEGNAINKTAQATESMAAATKASNVPKVGKSTVPTPRPAPMELQPQKTIYNPSVAETQDMASSSMGVKVGRNDKYGVPFIQSGKTPVNRGTTMDINAPTIGGQTEAQLGAKSAELQSTQAAKVAKMRGEVAPEQAPTKQMVKQAEAPAAVSEPLPTQKPGKLDKSIQNSENNRAQSLFGKDATTTKEYQKPLDDARRKELDAYAKSKGITATQPQKAAQQLEANHQQVTKNLKETLTRTNRPVTQAERDKLAKDIEAAWAKDTNVASSNPKLKKDILDRIRHAEDSKDLESLAKYRSGTLDAGAKYNAMGDSAGTANSTINKLARNAVNKFTGSASPEYKAAQQEFRLSKEAAARANTSSGRVVDAKIPIVNLPIRGSGQAVEGALNKARNVKVAATKGYKKAAYGSDGTPPPNPAGAAEQAAAQTGEQVAAQAGKSMPKGFMPYVKAGVKQELSRAIVGPMLPEGMQPEQAQADVAAIDQYDGTPDTPEVTPDTPQGPFSDPQMVQQAYLAALADGNTKAASMILDGYKMFGPEAAGATKAKSAESAKVSGIVNSGLSSLAQLESQIANGGVPVATTLPGRGLFGGLLGNATGTADYDTAANNIADAMVRLRTGAAATKQELELYRELLPQAFDSPEVQQQKLQQVKSYFADISNGTGGAGTDIQSLLGAK